MTAAPPPLGGVTMLDRGLRGVTVLAGGLRGDRLERDMLVVCTGGRVWRGATGEGVVAGAPPSGMSLVCSRTITMLMLLPAA